MNNKTSKTFKKVAKQKNPHWFS